MDRLKVLVVSEEGFSWFLVASALDRRSLVLQWQRSAADLEAAAGQFGPHLIVVGEVGTTQEDMVSLCRRAAHLGCPVLALDLPGFGIDPEALRAAGCRDVLPVGAGTDDLRARLLHHLGLAAAREPRLRVARPAVLEIGGRAHAGTTVDLGPGGAALRVLGTFQPGDEGTLSIELSGSAPLRCTVEVLRVADGVVAVRFLDLSAADVERLTAMARRGVRDLPPLFEGVPRFVDVLLQVRGALVDGDLAGPLPGPWLERVLTEMPEGERQVVAAFDPSAFTTHREEDDDLALLLAARLVLARCGEQLEEWAALPPTGQVRVSETVRVNLLAAERVFKDTAVRVALRRGDRPAESDPIAPGQRALLEIALPVRDRFNALAGDQPVAAFPALQVPDDYFRAARGTSVRYDPSAFRVKDRTPRRVEFSAVPWDAHPPSRLRRSLGHPAVAAALAVLAALGIAFSSAWRGSLPGTGPDPLTAEEIARFGGLVMSGVIQGNDRRILMATIDPERWNALDPEGQRAALAGIQQRLAGLRVKRATLFDPRGELLAVLSPDVPIAAPRSSR